MSTRFVACPDCARHVRGGDCACPFCGAKVSAAGPLRTVTERLSRAAVHAAGAAGVAVVLADCSGHRAEPGYGIACDPCEVFDATASDSNTAVFYGAPCVDGDCPLPDASNGGQEASADAGADATNDATNDADGGTDHGSDADRGDAPADVGSGS